MIKLLLPIIFVFLSEISVFAQVGIGTIPKSNSILDLTNSNNKYLILPITYGNPETILNDTSAVIYHDNNIYFKTTDGIIVFTPWKWDGNPTSPISTYAGSYVGIGLVPNTSDGLLNIKNSPGEIKDTTEYASVLVGDPNAWHLSVDNDEIMAKKDPNTTDTLKLQEEGGDVIIRNVSSDADQNTVLSAYGSINSMGKVKENGKVLIPVGSIFMWSGSSVPAGWALCDGGSYILEDGSGNINTPNLMDRFIVGADIGGNGINGTYSIDSIGGSATCAHTHTVNPDVYTTPCDGSHNHSLTGADSPVTVTTSCPGCVSNDFATNNHMHSVNNSTHSHTIDYPQQTSFGASSAENRPPYYALAFIMKL